MYNKLSSSGAFDREKWAQALSPILSLWQKLAGDIYIYLYVNVYRERGRYVYVCIEREREKWAQALSPIFSLWQKLAGNTFICIYFFIYVFIYMYIYTTN